MAFAVPEGDGELPLEMLEHLFLVIFPEMRNELGIAMGAKAVPLRFELGFNFGIVEEFAVEDGRRRSDLRSQIGCLPSERARRC